MAKIDRQLLDHISGFPDMAPREAIIQGRVIDIIRRHYERAGFVPLETPIVERPEVLNAKAGENKKQIYALRLLNPVKKGEEGDDDPEDDTKHLGLRFDHTVPLARYVAKHAGSGVIRFPFRRYAIGPSFRGEKPGPNRFRQFIQADIDIIGDGLISEYHDAEAVDVVCRIFEDLQVGPFVIRINNRKIIDAILRNAGFDTDEKIAKARTAIDKIDKTGTDRAVAVLTQWGMESDAARVLIHTLREDREADNTIAMLRSQSLGPQYDEGVNELESLVRNIRLMGVPDNRFQVDLSLVRGLDYYTGSVFELYLADHADLTVAAGGRFDNLAEQFTDRHLPGVGISIGVTRLVSRLIADRKEYSAEKSTLAPVLVTTMALGQYAEHYFAQATELREAGIATEIYLNVANIGDQMTFASRRGFSVAIISGENELATESPTVVVRNLRTRAQKAVPRAELVATVESML